MNVQDEIKALKQRISELEQQVEQEKEFPKDGDEYWYLNDEGYVFGTFYDNHYIDRYHQEIGNIFQTKEQAQFAVEKLKVEAELRKFSKPLEMYGRNYSILWDDYEKDIEVDWICGIVRQGVIYFESEEKAYQAIKSVGEDRIKKYIFGLEE